VFATLAASGAMAKSLSVPAAEEPALRAATAEPPPMPPELQRRLHERIIRTMERRVPVWRPPG